MESEEQEWLQKTQLYSKWTDKIKLKTILLKVQDLGFWSEKSIGLEL